MVLAAMAWQLQATKDLIASGASSQVMMEQLQSTDRYTCVCVGGWVREIAFKIPLSRSASKHLSRPTDLALINNLALFHPVILPLLLPFTVLLKWLIWCAVALNNWK